MSKLNPTVHERLAVIEQRMDDTERKLDEFDRKIDLLLSFKDKGAGAFWLASILFGTGIVGTIVLIMNWFHGK